MSRIVGITALLVWFIFASAASAQSGATLQKVKTAGSLRCGMNIEEPEYSTEDAHGNHSAFDKDICKALAVATLGANAKFTVVSYRDERDALKALKAGEIEALATGTVNLVNTADTALGFSRPVFYDYQGLLVNKTMGINSSKDLAGKKVCFLTGTELEYQLEGYRNRAQIPWLRFPFSEEGEMEVALVTRNCAAVSADVSQLAYERSTFKNMARNFEILPDVIAKDPLAVTFRSDDPQWARIVDWSVEILIEAEEEGVTQANVAEMKKSEDPLVQRLLGTHHGWWQSIGLEDGWAANVIEAVGNYGEIFDRDLGSRSPMGLVRGPNELWTHGGLMYALPMR